MMEQLTAVGQPGQQSGSLHPLGLGLRLPAQLCHHPLSPLQLLFLTSSPL